MKTSIVLLIVLILLTLNGGCQNKTKKNSSSQIINPIDTKTVADTGYTGIRRFFSKGSLVKEVTYKNGIREGLMKTYNVSGQLYQTFWYENGLRQDTAKFYFPDGKVFRATPFKDDSAHGIQTQYYRSGAVRAKLNFVNGLRTPFLEEFESNGKKITNYPDLVIRIKDEYSQNGAFKIYLELTNKDMKTNYYRGEYIDGLFNPKKYTKINSSETTGYLELRKSVNTGNNYVGIIAEILTPLGNRYLVYKKIDLPYDNLK
jgi:antitoxin component YwqK of YwqJK toxin-antitoxin module